MTSQALHQDVQLASVTDRYGTKPDAPFRWRPWLLLASIVGFLCLALDVEVIEKVDSLSLYLRYSEIALDVGVALLILCIISVIFWLCILLLLWMAGFSIRTERYRPIVWQCSLCLAFCYFALSTLGALRLLVFPRWHPGWVAWTLLCAGILVFWVLALHHGGRPYLQEFCRSQLSPIGWFHMTAAVIAAMALWAHGVHLFRDYVHPSNALATSNSPDVYLITIDALRAQDMSVYGYGVSTTPELQRFAQQSFTFDYFFSNSNFTGPTTTSIETGKLPWSHRVFQMGAFLRGAAQHKNLAEVLRQHGYYTAMITSNYAASPFRHRTMESYDAVEYSAQSDITGAWMRYTNLVGVNAQNTLFVSLLSPLGHVRSYVDRLILHGRYPCPAEAVFDRTKGLLERSAVPQPRFVWAHILPPHDPYWPPPSYQGRFSPTNSPINYNDLLRLTNDKLPPGLSAAELRGRYDEMVLYADHVVGDFLNWLDQTGRLNRAIVIITADHGESFEHGWYLHTGPYLYNGLIRVPLIIHLPGQREGARISQIAEQADLLPTIMDLIGGDVPAWTDGISLRPALEGKRLPARFVFSMNLEPDRVFDPISRGTVAIIDDEFKYVDYLGLHKQALYRYKLDANEEQNLVMSEPIVAQHMQEVLLSQLNKVNQQFSPKQ